MTETNGFPPIMPHLAQANPITQLLEQLLAGARAGQITSLGVVAVPVTGGYSVLSVGAQMGDLYIGCGSLQKKILESVEAPQKRSSIIPARMG